MMSFGFSALLSLFLLTPCHLSMYLSMYPSIYLSIYLSIYVSIYVSIYLCTYCRVYHAVLSFLHFLTYLFFLFLHQFVWRQLADFFQLVSVAHWQTPVLWTGNYLDKDVPSATFLLQPPGVFQNVFFHFRF